MSLEVNGVQLDPGTVCDLRLGDQWHRAAVMRSEGFYVRFHIQGTDTIQEHDVDELRTWGKIRPAAPAMQPAMARYIGDDSVARRAYEAGLEEGRRLVAGGEIRDINMHEVLAERITDDRSRVINLD